MQHVTPEHLKAVKFLEQSQDLAKKIGELAKAEKVSRTVFMFSILASVDALEKAHPEQFSAVEEFFNLLTEERGN